MTAISKTPDPPPPPPAPPPPKIDSPFRIKPPFKFFTISTKVLKFVYPTSSEGEGVETIILLYTICVWDLIVPEK